MRVSMSAVRRMRAYVPERLARTRGRWGLGVAFTVLRGTAIGGLRLVGNHMIKLWFDWFRGRPAQSS